jgi:formylglycine-generating enzyme required for sulfatase activity
VPPSSLPSRPAGLAAYRVRRGGSWFNDAARCRSANRDWFVPGFRSYDLGFRPVLTLASK